MVMAAGHYLYGTRQGARVVQGAEVTMAMHFALVLALAAAAQQDTAPAIIDPAVPPVTKPRVELVFALDTTGSMSGLIDGAKRKIWFIVDEVLKAKVQPDVKVGIVAYRDRSDAYVTKVTALSSDL